MRMRDSKDSIVAAVATCSSRAAAGVSLTIFSIGVYRLSAQTFADLQGRLWQRALDCTRCVCNGQWAEFFPRAHKGRAVSYIISATIAGCAYCYICNRIAVYIV